MTLLANIEFTFQKPSLVHLHRTPGKDNTILKNKSNFLFKLSAHHILIRSPSYNNIIPSRFRLMRELREQLLDSRFRNYLQSFIIFASKDLIEMTFSGATEIGYLREIKIKKLIKQ